MSRERERRLWLVLALGMVAACSPGTEVVLTIDSDELQVPADLQKLCITVTNPSVGPTPIYQSQDLAVCPPGKASHCFALPLSVTLTPGPKRAEDAVRVEVLALRAETSCSDPDAAMKAVASDASVFTFVKGESQKLDFFLYRSCLDKKCALMDQACDRAGQCVTVTPGATSLDLATPPDLPVAPIARVSAMQGAVTPAASQVVIPPPTTVAKDLVVLFLDREGELAVPSALSPATGWISLGTNPVYQDYFEVGYRIANGNEVDQPDKYTFAATAGNTAPVHYVRLVYRGAASAEQIAVGGGDNADFTMLTLQPAPSPKPGSVLLDGIGLFNEGGCALDGGAAPPYHESMDAFWNVLEIQPGTANTTALSWTCSAGPGAWFQLELNP